MNFETYLLSVKMRCKPFELPLQVEHAQIGMLTELGELGDLIKRAFVYGKPFDKVNLLEECGDLLWYFTLYCDCRQIHTQFLEGVTKDAYEKIAKNGTGKWEGERKMLRALSAVTLTLVADDILMEDMLARNATALRHEAVESSLLLIIAFLHQHGCTLAQCMVANDAKLEARTGKKFDAGLVLGRDKAAERTILEDHAGEAQAGQAAG